MNGKIFLHIPGRNQKNAFFFDESQLVSGVLTSAGNSHVHVGWGKKTVAAPEKNEASSVKKAWFRRVTAPALVRNSGADVILNLDERPIRMKEKPQMNAVLTPPKKERTQVFTPDAALASRSGIPWLPAFPDPKASALNWEAREQLKETLTEGKEFFLTLLDAHHKAALTQMLKAYSLFKQRQRTGLRWLFAGTEAEIAAFKTLTASYKLRDHLTMLPLQTAALPVEWVAASYALVYFPSKPGWHLPLYNALAAGTPVITASGYAAIPGEHCALITEATPNELSEALKLIFKDEALRSKLIHNGLERVRLFSPEASREKINEWFRT